ncbi:hypothetical protein [Halomonas campaniensis]|uniref:Uncharacterized protein n=1 Tax=Halomonas campaniensis TaxID=213554 RepID=A0A246S462_9GAMM|nr:hypothetical protein [Halomonas campaniensis]OWV31247.1 hypothetical protein JI62_02545 [Halomonas campaniensis]
MAKKSISIEEHYIRYKIIMRNPQLSPRNEDEVRVFTQKMRYAIRAKYYGTAISGLIMGILSLILIVGFFLIPMSFVAFYLGSKELRFLKLCEERYIENKEWEKERSYTE